MPQLPSGKHVDISKDRLLDWASGIDFSIAIQFSANITRIDELHHFVDLVYYQNTGTERSSAEPAGESYLSGLRVSDVGTYKCDWPREDQDWFSDWLKTKQALEWFETLQEELHEILRNKPLPIPLKGFLDDEY
ncbi:MAG: hypothetical protein EP297_03735 [Gammaproteobacteria bacterium]|nr:MAG: hypothetical protein EP297_03735 [Gammaproteobacteria bacterium]